MKFKLEYPKQEPIHDQIRELLDTVAMTPAEQIGLLEAIKFDILNGLTEENSE